MLYYSLVCSRMQYGIILWGTANVKDLNVIKVIQMKILRAMLFSDTPLQTESLDYFLSRVNKMFGKKQLAYRGVELWGKLHPNFIIKHCIAFKKEMKLSFLCR